MGQNITLTPCFRFTDVTQDSFGAAEGLDQKNHKRSVLFKLDLGDFGCARVRLLLASMSDEKHPRIDLIMSCQWKFNFKFNLPHINLIISDVFFVFF